MQEELNPQHPQRGGIRREPLSFHEFLSFLPKGLPGQVGLPGEIGVLGPKVRSQERENLPSFHLELLLFPSGLLG